MSSEKTISKFIGRITCFSDYETTGIMDRTIEKLDPESCIIAYKALINFPSTTDKYSLLDRVGKWLQTEKISSIRELSSKWNIEQVCKSYEWQKKEILAVEKLTEIYENNSDPKALFKMGLAINIPMFTLKQIMEYRIEIPICWVYTLNNIQNTNISYIKLFRLLENSIGYKKRSVEIGDYEYSVLCHIEYMNDEMYKNVRGYPTIELATEMAQLWWNEYKNIVKTGQAIILEVNIYAEQKLIWSNGKQVEDSGRLQNMGACWNGCPDVLN